VSKRRFFFYQDNCQGFLVLYGGTKIYQKKSNIVPSRWDDGTPSFIGSIKIILRYLVVVSLTLSD
jgi:hypothetical protein